MAFYASVRTIDSWFFFLSRASIVLGLESHASAPSIRFNHVVASSRINVPVKLQKSKAVAHSWWNRCERVFTSQVELVTFEPSWNRNRIRKIWVELVNVYPSSEKPGRVTFVWNSHHPWFLPPRKSDRDWVKEMEGEWCSHLVVRMHSCLQQTSNSKGKD